VNVGFVGLGNMGQHMAHNLGRAGHAVAVYDLRPEAAAAVVARTPGARQASSIADAAREADVVGTSLPMPADVEAVVLGAGGLGESMRPGSIYVDLSTNAPTVARRLAAALAERQIAMLDAPVSGGVRGAEGASLSVMVGGDRAVYDRAQPFLSAIGDKLFYCGEIGNGSVVKLCNNMAALAYGVILGEVLTLGVKAGVDLATLASVIGASTGRHQRLTEGFPAGVFRRNFERVGFSVALSAKDTRLAVELGHDLGVPLAVGEIVASDLREAVERGLGRLDFDAVVQVQEQRTGVTLELSEQQLEQLKPTVSA